MDYLFLDFGNVICYPTTGDWFITPFFDEYIKEHNLSREDILSCVKYYGELLDGKYLTMEDEYEMFYEFYKGIFERLNYKIRNRDIEVIADDITYSTTKYQLFRDIRDELVELKNRHNLILLSDNWPCGEYLMKAWMLDQYFKKMYISSYYGIKKDNPDFFRLPMDEFGIRSQDITFVDDNDVPLDTADSLGIKVYKMDRFNKIQQDKYPVIHNLKGI